MPACSPPIPDLIDTINIIQLMEVIVGKFALLLMTLMIRCYQISLLSRSSKY